MHDRTADIDRFYELMESLAVRLGGPRILRECSAGMKWPQRGVYFFFEGGETRSGSHFPHRVVRVGTSTTLWKRLRQHLGSVTKEGGNHRVSAFRRLVGPALAQREDVPLPASWRDKSKLSDAERDARNREEASIEILVSRTIGAMPVLWIEVGDPQREMVERNAIALVSNYAEMGPDLPSLGWLGHHSDRKHVRRSGLWNIDHVDGGYDPAFLDLLEDLIEETPQP